jgi:outer membrane receptor protein involved in Fe transport
VRLCVWILLLAGFPAWGQGGLADASLEQLLETRVTTLSKKAQALSKTAAAAFVIGPEDIRRSGALTLPDLLRMAPGVDVAQINANTWAITIRGCNSRYSNKVLVLVDGRSVYTPAFSGVYWDHLDLPLEDIERIEVIRGPGASTWGANAVNGVINIITKPAAATQGGLAVAVGGSEIHANDTLQYGGTAGTRGAYRAQFSPALSLDIASFVTHYGRLATIEPGTPEMLPGSPAVVNVPWHYANLATGRSSGGELALTWHVAPRWRLAPSYSYLNMELRRAPGSLDGAIVSLTAMAPRQMAGTRSLVNLTRRLEFDQWLAWTGPLAGTDVPGYIQLDLRAARRFGESIEVSVGGQNLLRPGTEAERSVYGRVQWTF